ncbi:MAG TPA: bifunctional shikimate kinase/3-dehydroquinate synthase [Candidatus Limnocylindrales bacterium]|nr:bifunctional shikimate kinase/3-dehydroquinate synthase [Candidatus Limnocylindrales bacterium]
MELVLVGLSGSGKSAVGRRLAERAGAEFIDLDESVAAEASLTVEAIFAAEGEAGFRARESAAVAGLGAPDGGSRLRRVIATGGGAVIDPRNRWRLFRGRAVAWLDAPPEVLLGRLRGGEVRPLLAGDGPAEAIGRMAAERRRFYAAGVRVDASRSLDQVVEAAAAVADATPRIMEGDAAGDRGASARADATPRISEEGGSGCSWLMRAESPIGRVELGEGVAAAGVRDALVRIGAGRAAVVSEPEAWRRHGERLAAALSAAGVTVLPFLAPRGERAKTPRAYERLVRALAGARLERGEPIVAVGGGALGDLAGFAAATWLRGVPLIQVPTTLVGQIDSAIGGKTALDLPEGKNLVGAFHLPESTVLDVSMLRTLPPRQVRAALGEAVKMAALGDERLLSLLEREGPAIARGEEAAYESGALAELVERCAWAKVAVVAEDPKEISGRRMVLNLGHTIGHALEAATGYRRLLHGEAVAYGLRGALAIGMELGVTPAGHARRLLELLDRLGLATAPLELDPAVVGGHLGGDKKQRGGRLHWVLVSAGGVDVRADVPEAAVTRGIAAALAGRARGRAAA